MPTPRVWDLYDQGAIIDQKVTNGINKATGIRDMLKDVPCGDEGEPFSRKTVGR